MKRLVTLVVVVIVLYVGYTQALPWIRQQMGQSVVGDTTATRCVRQADLASNTFGDNFVKHFRPDAESNYWDGFIGDVRKEIAAARALCSCSGAACRKAKTAMDALDDLVADYDERFHSDLGMRPNPAGELSRVHDLLNEARALARQGG